MNVIQGSFIRKWSLHSMTSMRRTVPPKTKGGSKDDFQVIYGGFQAMPPRSPFVIAPPLGLSRRRFVQGLAAGGVLAGLSTPALRAFAQQGSATRGAAPVLKGTEFDLVIAESPVNFTGKPGVATTINGSLPAPTLRWREGDTRSEEHTSELQSPCNLVCRLLLEKKKKKVCMRDDHNSNSPIQTPFTNIPPNSLHNTRPTLHISANTHKLYQLHSYPYYNDVSTL